MSLNPKENTFLSIIKLQRNIMEREGWKAGLKKGTINHKATPQVS